MRDRTVERLKVDPSYILTETVGHTTVKVVLYGKVDDTRIEQAHKDAKRRAYQLDV